jgi:polyribonucleotide nucleotidyltransferase
MSYYKNHKIYDLEIAGKKYQFDFGKFATLTNSSCVVSCGGTSVLATVVMSRTARPIDFMPLMVNYQEKLYAAGMIKSSRFQKRETRPSDDKILISRVIDRSLRPLFPKHLRNDVQVMLTTLSYDRENEHDICAALGASAALTASNIPFDGPMAMSRVGLINNELVLNPSVAQRAESDLDLIVSATTENVVMIEAAANEVDEAKMMEAISFGKEAGKKICAFMNEIRADRGEEKVVLDDVEVDEEMNEWVKNECEKDFQECLWGIPGKVERMAKKAEIGETAKQKALDEAIFDEERIEKFFDKATYKVWKKILRDAILNEEKRIAGRKLDEIRPINIEKDLFERTHGSALFQRGETQGLTLTTLAAPSEAQIIEGIEGESKARYFHHYNFPPYSVSDTSNRLSTGNREIGHGKLAERALLPVLPDHEDFPYTIRTVTEILMSNGSSSMAATCGSTLSLMAAGVPLKAPVSGIAMGLITSEDGQNYKILSDIQDDEDFVGDMDFKVTGTEKGITAIQMDIKVSGITNEIFEKALAQAKKGRIEILGKMLAVVPTHAENLSKYAPRLTTIKINPEYIGKIIGKGGETIQKMTAETGCTIDIEEDGTIIIGSSEGEEGTIEVLKTIHGLTFEPQVGETYDAIVGRITEYGAFVDITPSVGGLVHISLLANERVEKVEDVVKEGQKIRVKLLEIDRQGRMRLSMKDAE